MMGVRPDLNGIPALEQRANSPIRNVISDLDGVACREEKPITSSVRGFAPDLVISDLLYLVDAAPEETGDR